MLWELPAGLIEPDEAGDAVRQTAARETEEETGYAVAPEAFEALGPAVFLTPGLCAEKIHFVHASVDPAARGASTSSEAVERLSELAWTPLSEALARASLGEIQDCKTELGLRRLRERLAPPTHTPPRQVPQT
jgi:ADP-ribose pyrophosphatase